MTEEVYIGQSPVLMYLKKYAEEVTTEQGNIYYRFPCWFRMLPNGLGFTMYKDTDIPEDLQMFITKAGLGEPNPQIKKPEL